MKTAIVTDSAAYLSPDVAAAAGVTVVPMTVIFGDEVLYENETITTEAFYKRMRDNQELPTTSQTPPGRLDEAYRALKESGYDNVLSIHLSGVLSGMAASAAGFAADYDVIPVTVHDSKSVSAGEANQVQLAARLLAEGQSVADILPVLDRFNTQVHVDVMVASLKHLQRTGRLSGSAAFIGNLMAVKPLLGLADGALVPVGKARTTKKALKQMAENALAHADEIEGDVRFTIIDANNPEAVAQLSEAVLAVRPDAIIDRSTIGPVVGVHSGDGVIGIFTAPDWKTFS